MRQGGFKQVCSEYVTNVCRQSAGVICWVHVLGFIGYGAVQYSRRLRGKPIYSVQENSNDLVEKKWFIMAFCLQFQCLLSPLSRQ